MTQDRKKVVHETLCFDGVLNVKNPLYRDHILNYVLDAVQFDLGSNGDVTSEVLLSSNIDVKGLIICKSKGILAGVEEVKYFIKEFNKIHDGNLKFVEKKKDGAGLRKKDVIGYLIGDARNMMEVERTVLNLIQRMSGIATMTFDYVKRVKGEVLVVTTRKTAWGLLDKKACVVGGGGTHRLNLSDAVLVKDTHLDIESGNLKRIFKNLRRVRGSARFIEVEVNSIRDAIYAVDLYKKYLADLSIPFFLMLDNMKSSRIKKIISGIKVLNSPNIYFEASGGITKRNIKSFVKSGVDVVSIGALTHSVKALDFSLKIK